MQWLNQRVYDSVGFGRGVETQPVILAIPADGWTPAYDGDGRVGPGAWLTEITDMIPLRGRPAGCG